MDSFEKLECIYNAVKRLYILVNAILLQGNLVIVAKNEEGFFLHTWIYEKLPSLVKFLNGNE